MHLIAFHGYSFYSYSSPATEHSFIGKWHGGGGVSMDHIELWK